MMLFKSMGANHPKARTTRAALPCQRGAAFFRLALHLTAGLLLGGAFSSTSMAMNTPVEVSARIQDQGSQLHVQWTITNKGEAALWVARQPDAAASWSGTQTLYLEQGPGGELHFSLKAFALPEGVLASTYKYLILEELKPGAQLQATGDIRMPPETHVPYQISPRQPLSADARKARLCIGFWVQKPDARPAFQRPDGTLRLPHEAGLARAQQLACSPAVTW